jgi:hypothetical protein
MKTFAALATVALLSLPSLAHATYVCDKLFAEMHEITCPAGSVWDTHYHACIVTSG